MPEVDGVMKRLGGIKMFLALMSNQGIFPWLLAFTVSCAGLNGPGPVSVKSGEVQREKAVNLNSEIYYLLQPKILSEEYQHPDRLIRQTFIWDNSGAEWQIHWAGHHHAFAGFVFRHPFNFSKNKSSYTLRFSLSPRDTAQYLAVGLVDGSHVMVELPLASYGRRGAGGWKYCVLKLDEFDRAGTPVSETAMNNKETREPFNWSDVREIRIRILSDKQPESDMKVRSLRFAPVGWCGLSLFFGPEKLLQLPDLNAVGSLDNIRFW